MPVRIFCQCGKDITNTVSMWDMKTRSVFWMDQHSPSCAACSKRRVLAPAKPAWAPRSAGAEAGRKKAAAR
jgi:hypothetical protein